ncbi:MAG: hypothetical protein AAGC67_16655 [Myxococcota bacterium]
MERTASLDRWPLRRLVRLWLTAVLVVAAVVHGVAPEVFLPSMPPAIPFPGFWVAFTGGLELLAAVGLWVPRFRRATGTWLAIYFVAILPAHFHVALNDIPMFGLRNPWLWIRIPFQAVFIAAAWGLREADDVTAG